MTIVNAQFEITAKGYPAISYQWYIGDEADPLDRTILTNDGTYDTVTTRILNIYDVNSGLNQTKYSCKVTNSVGSVWSNLATLTVDYAPFFTLQPVTQEVALAATLTLTVTVSAEPSATYLWYKDAVLISNGGRVSGATTNSLVITDLESGDAASYTCKATNSKGFATSDAAVVTVNSCSSPFQECYWDATNGMEFTP
jgi:hypothetical protein